MAQHDTHDHPGGAAQPTISELADNAAELADNAAELRPMMASVTVSLVEAVVERWSFWPSRAHYSGVYSTTACVCSSSKTDRE